MIHKRNRIKIITLRGYYNYGNRLQNYALSLILSRLGFRVRTQECYSLKQLFYSSIILKFFYGKNRIKEHKLCGFTKKMIKHDYPWFMKPDYVVVGSDQVWNPEYIEHQPFLLTNKEKKAITISYAASLGIDSLTDQQKTVFSNALKNYKAISVREESAKNLLQTLTKDKEIEVVLDPTLLLSKKEYECIEKRPGDLKDGEKYILCYILGDREYQDVIEGYAAKNHYRIIVFSDKQDSKYGIEEFLYLIHHAQLVCTDSFHASVFSFIFERPFVIFKRTGKANYMYTRLQNLIQTFNLKDREYNGKEITKHNAVADYSEAKEILRRKIDESISFIKKSLGLGNEG